MASDKVISREVRRQPSCPVHRGRSETVNILAVRFRNSADLRQRMYLLAKPVVERLLVPNVFEPLWPRRGNLLESRVLLGENLKSTSLNFLLKVPPRIEVQIAFPPIRELSIDSPLSPLFGRCRSAGASVLMWLTRFAGVPTAAAVGQGKGWSRHLGCCVKILSVVLGDREFRKS